MFKRERRPFEASEVLNNDKGKSEFLLTNIKVRFLRNKFHLQRITHVGATACLASNPGKGLFA